MRLTYELGHKGSGEYEPVKIKDMPINGYIACVNKLGKLEDLIEDDSEAVGLLFTMSTYQEFLKGNEEYCQITLNREQVAEIARELDILFNT